MTIPWWWTALVAPVLTGMLGVGAGYLAIRFDLRKSTNQELIKKRIALYDDVAPRLNDIFCFFLSVGPWKDLPPPLIIQKKRELDRVLYVYGPLFSPDSFLKYQHFMDVCFKTYVGAGRDALIRANAVRISSEWGDGWKTDWDKFFVETKEITSREPLTKSYEALMKQLAAEIGANTGAAK